MPVVTQAKRSGSKRRGGSAASAPFELSLLGPVRLTGPHGQIDLGNRKLCALLVFLVCAGAEPVSRETLRKLLWNTLPKSRADQNLNQMVTRLRRAIDDDVVKHSEQGLLVASGLIRCDVLEFRAQVASAVREKRIAALERYSGTFLANVEFAEDAWTNWVNTRRQQFESLALNALVELSEAAEQLGDSAQALVFANRAVAINGLREDAHRVVIRCLANAGRRAEALKHYDDLVVRLKREVNVEADAATAALTTTLRPSASQSPSTEMSLQGSIATTPSTTTILPSIAVLPFQNLSGDSGDDYFAEGIVEDIIVSLASLRELLVISRTSTLVFRGGEAAPREIGKSLDVRYLLQGSVRKNETSVRVSTRLCDAETGASLWGERYDVPLGDLFEVQDRIVHDVVARLAPNVEKAELERAMRIRPTNFTSYDHTLRALNIINNLDRQTFETARHHLDMAMVAHPSFAMPAAWAAFWHILCVGQGWSEDAKRDADEAATLATKAIELDPHNALALATYGHVRSFLFHDYESALVYFDRAQAAGPNNSWAWILSSVTLSYLGSGADAVRHAERGLRLSPYDRSLYFFYGILAIAHYASGNYETAIKWGRMSVAENGGFTAPLRYLAASLAAANRVVEAREAAAAMMELEPGFKLEAYERTRQPFKQQEAKERHLAHLRTAGLPQ